MLLPWSKPVTVALSANGIAIDNNDGSPKLLAQADDVYKNASELTDAWASVSDTVQSKSIRFVISNHYVRYLSLPWQEGVTSRKDWVALAEHAFRKSFGHVAESWQVQVAFSHYGNPVTACAIDQSFISDLHAIASENQCNITAIEPLLMRVTENVNLEDDVWVLLGEPGRVLLAEYVAGYWANFSTINPPSGMELTQSEQLIVRNLAQTTKRPTRVLACISPQLGSDWQMKNVKLSLVNTSGVNNTDNSALWMAAI